MIRRLVTQTYYHVSHLGGQALTDAFTFLRQRPQFVISLAGTVLLISAYWLITGKGAAMPFTLLAIGFSLASGLVGLGADRHPRLLRHTAFGLLGLSGVAGLLGGGTALIGGVSLELSLPLGLPWLAWHLHLDALAGFFLCVISVVLLAVALFGPHYVQEYEHGPHPLSLLALATGLFIAGMQLVLLAADAFFFMIAWELMSVASYFLVAYSHEHAANRHAAFIYLLMAEIGALLIILAYGVLVDFGDGFTFEQMRHAELTPLWAAVAFVLALGGFGMKAGIVPLHAWLPEAHPVAPSHISALMSGVMLKVAVYGFIRFTFDLVGPEHFHWGWGVAVLVAGSASAALGVLYALMQHNLKRLLAYHSVENIGIIFMGLGLALLFYSDGKPTLGAIGLIAALYHTLNHAIFKSLLFLGAGVILQRTHENDIEHMGGLIHRMPITAVLFLIGCVSISALPPFNGFVSEWLTYQAALQVSALDSGVLRSFVPVTAAMLALTGGLAVSMSTTNLSAAIETLLHEPLTIRPSFVFAGLGLTLVAVAETGRIPVDNPATHLELTMIHEAMILEYSGHHLALIEWAAQIRMAIYAVLLVNIFLPWGLAENFTWTAMGWGGLAVAGKLTVLAILLVLAETALAKMRLFSYSSIEHMGTMTFAFGIGTPLATFAALMHMTVHSLTKSAIVASPRHADMLLVTGPVSRHMETALLRTYEAAPDPKWVIACGDCAVCGGEFGLSYASCGTVDNVIPVDVKIPGCPPPPSVLLAGILEAIGKRRK